MPELVVYKDGQPETVMYHMLPPLLLKALQEVMQQNDERDKTIEEQAKRIEKLDNKIELLQSLIVQLCNRRADCF
jgi:hypothetical protein